MTGSNSTPPAGYMSRVKSVSKQEAVSTYTADNIKTIVKYAVEVYIRSFFDVAGVNRRFLKVTPTAFNYVSDPDFDTEKDPTRTKLTIDRMTERVVGALPSIVIADTGMTLRTPGFGKSTQQSKSLGSNNLYRVAHCIHVFREIPVTILVATNSQSSTECIAQALHAMFFDLSNLICGRTLKPPDGSDSTWSIRLPQTMDPGTTEKSSQTEDVNEQVWMCPLSMSLFFEDSYDLADDDIDPVVHTAGDSIDPVIVCDSTVRVGRRTTITVLNMQADMRLVLNNRNIATLAEGPRPTEFVLLAKQPGTLSVQLIQRAATNQPLQGSSIQPKIVVSKELTLTY